MSTVITPFQGTEPFSTVTFNNRISQINTGFSYISNPNLLDNWYFGNPVDQRGGYVVYAGANLYSDASCTTIIGTVAGGPYTARAISAICVSFISNATYYCKIGDTGVVRGYTGAGYGIDRWKMVGDSAVILIGDNCVTLKGTTSSAYWIETIENAAQLIGRAVTFSVLYTGNNLQTASGILTNNGQIVLTGSPGGWDSVSVSGNVVLLQIAANAGAEKSPIAVKLELGSQQTLAHQDADGNWALNEIPDYGEQLRRCQKYYVKGRLSRVPTLIYGSGKELWFSIKLPVPMRAAIPALVKITTYAWIYHQGTAYDANGAQEFLPGESTNFITTDTDCTHSGEIGVHLTLDNALTNAVDGSTGWIAYIDYELTENL